MLVRIRGRLLVVGIAVGVSAVALPPATAAGARYDYSAGGIRLSADRPAKPFGLAFGYRVVDVTCGRDRRCPFNPDVQPGDKPKNPVEIKVHLPRGTRYNRDGAVICSFARAIETDACPRGSLLGTGVVGYDWRPYSDEDLWLRAGTLKVVHAFGKVHHPDRPNDELLGNGLGFFMSLSLALGLPNPLIAYPASMTRRGVLTITLPPRIGVDVELVGMSGGVSGVLTALGFRIRKNAQLNGTPLLRTPRRCVPEKGWKTKTVVTYQDNSTKTFISRHPCHRG